MSTSSTRLKSNWLLTLALIATICLAGVYCQKVWEVFGRSAGAVGDNMVAMDFAGGQLWVSTTWVDPDADEAPLEGGISLLDQDSGNFTTYTPEHGLAHVKVPALMIDGKKIWCGTPRGVSVFDTAKAAELDPFEINQAFTKYTKEEGLIDDDIKSLAKDGDLIWAGTSNGVNWLNTKTNTWSGIEGSELPGKTVNYIEIDGNDVWLATSAGLAKYNKDSGIVESVDVPGEGVGSDIMHVVTAEADLVWVGTRMGVFVMDKSSGEWTSYGEDVLPDIWVNEILLTDGKAYVSTLKGGLAILDREKDKWKVIDTKKGLSSNEINAAFPADDVLWIGTAKGLNRYYPAAAAKQLQRMVMYVAIIAIAIVGVVAAKLTIFKPSEEEVERKKRDEEARAKRKERKRTAAPPWQLCNGVPKKDLCGRCKYNQVRSGKLHCSKYDIDLE